MTAGRPSSGGKRVKAVGDVEVSSIRCCRSCQPSSNRALRPNRQPVCARPKVERSSGEFLTHASHKVEGARAQSNLHDRPCSPGQNHGIEGAHSGSCVSRNHPHRKAGLVQSVRIFDLLAATGLFLAVTDPADLSGALIDLLHPLDRGGRRLGAASLMLMVVFSFLPLVAEEAERLRTAVGTRCGFGGGPLGRARNAVALVAALIVGILRRAEELETSLTARRYTLERACHPSGTGPGAWDIAILCISIIIFAAGLYAQL